MVVKSGDLQREYTAALSQIVPLVSGICACDFAADIRNAYSYVSPYPQNDTPA